MHYIRSSKIIIACVLMGLMCLSRSMQAQRHAGTNNPHYDDRFLSYGFLIGLHTNAFQLKYSNEFLKQNNLQSINPSFSKGFSLGFIVNMKVAQYLDLRILPKASFNEHRLEYTYTDDTPSVTQLIESTVVELPILAKYKSVRRGNVRMYMVGGIKPGIEAAVKNELENQDDAVFISKTNLSLDFGFGFDFYYPLFKFSPELRFSKGITNMIASQSNEFNKGIQSLTTNTITLYLLFQ